MRVRDLPREQLLVYCNLINANGYPPEWIDLEFLNFCVWFDAVRADPVGTRARWNRMQELEHSAAILVQPILEKCPEFTLREAVELLSPVEREHFGYVLDEIRRLAAGIVV